MLYRTVGPSVFLCGLLQFQHMEAQGWISFRHMSIVHVQKDDLIWAEIVVFVRGDGALDEWMAKKCKKNGKRILYILDDDLLHVPLGLGSGAYYAQKSVKRHIRRLIEYSDYFASPSQKLIQMYGKRKASFLLIEPSVHKVTQKKQHSDGKVHIGFAGSPDRGSDIDLLLADALEQLVQKYGDRICLEFYGCETAIAKKLHCVTYSYTESYEAYQKQMAELNWDIGLAPMPDTHFHSCKHYNKLVEYCGFGIVGVYSRVSPYTEGVVDQVTGLLCGNTAQEWVDAISLLIEDSALRQRISENCINYAQEFLSVERAAYHFFQDICEIRLSKWKDDSIRFLTLMKALGVLSWYFEKYKKYGWQTPVIACKKAIKLLHKTV